MIIKARKLVRLLLVFPMFSIFYLYSKLRGYTYLEILSDRFGHHILDGCNKIILANEFPKNKIPVFFQLYKPVNKHWQKILNRKIGPIRDFSFYEPCIRRFKFSHNVFVRSKGQTLDIYGKYHRTSFARPVFTNAEEKQGMQWMKTHGIKSKKNLVCIMIRDSQYLNNANQFRKSQHDYHNYRDTDATDYTKAIEYLLDKGYVVIRMGRDMEKRMQIHHERFIDYAFDERRSDFLDIWLFANASRVIATGTGPDILANVVQTPTLYVNFLPLLNIHSFHHSYTFPKHLSWKKNGQRLRLDEHMKNGFSHSSDYINAGIEIKDLTPHEILIATREYIEKLDKNYCFNEADAKKQKLFWKFIKSCSEYKKLRPWKHPSAMICDSWLNIQKQDFFDTDKRAQ